MERNYEFWNESCIAGIEVTTPLTTHESEESLILQNEGMFFLSRKRKAIIK
jgi:hypothetical protein